MRPEKNIPQSENNEFPLEIDRDDMIIKAAEMIRKAGGFPSNNVPYGDLQIARTAIKYLMGMDPRTMDDEHSTTGQVINEMGREVIKLVKEEK